MQLNLPDAFAGRTSKCPACQKVYTVPGVAAEAKPASEDNVAVIPRAGSRGEMASLQAMMDEDDENDTGPKPQAPDPTAIDVCPGCGLKWKKNSRECKKCHYNVIVQRKLKPIAKPSNFKQAINFDVTQIFIWVLIGGVLYGGIWFYNNFNEVKRKGDKAFDEASQSKRVEDEANKEANRIVRP